MAEKEAIVFVVDVGATMARMVPPRTESNLDYALRYVYSRLGDMAATSRKTLCAGIVALRSRTTDNSMGDEAGYEHISVLQGLGPVSLDRLKELQAAVGEITKDGVEGMEMRGDAVSATIVAVDMIDRFTKKQRWTRRVCLVTDGEGAMDADDGEAVAEKMNASGIQMHVL